MSLLAEQCKAAADQVEPRRKQANKQPTIDRKLGDTLTLLNELTDQLIQIREKAVSTGADLPIFTN